MMTLMLIQVSALAGMAAAAPFLDTRALIEQALDEPTRITLTSIRLGEAVEVITEQTGVRIVMAPDVMGLTPQGADTLITEVDIANISLRDGLTRLFTPLGMTFVVESDHIAVLPHEALLGLGRAATWEELETLAWLSSISPGLDEQDLTSLQSRTQFHVPVPVTWKLLAGAIRNVGAGSGDEVLTVACRAMGWGWSLADRWIVVAPLEEHILRRLRQRITIRMRNRTLHEVMNAVGNAVNVRVRAEAGALVTLPPQIQRNFSLDVHQRTAEQALDEIAAYTGLGYLIDPGGVMFFRPTGHGGPPPDTAIRPSGAITLSDPYVGKMVVPLEDGQYMEWLIRQSELPEDLRGMRKRDLAEGFRTLRHRRAAAPGEGP